MLYGKTKSVSTVGLSDRFCRWQVCALTVHFRARRLEGIGASVQEGVMQVRRGAIGWLYLGVKMPVPIHISPTFST